MLIQAIAAATAAPVAAETVVGITLTPEHLINIGMAVLTFLGVLFTGLFAYMKNISDRQQAIFDDREASVKEIANEQIELFVNPMRLEIARQRESMEKKDAEIEKLTVLDCSNRTRIEHLEQSMDSLAVYKERFHRAVAYIEEVVSWMSISIPEELFSRAPKLSEELEEWMKKREEEWKE